MDPPGCGRPTPAYPCGRGHCPRDRNGAESVPPMERPRLHWASRPKKEVASLLWYINGSVYRKICYGNRGFSGEIWGFHSNFPLNPIHWYHDFPSAPLTNDTPAFRWFHHLPKPQKRHPLEQESLASGHEETMCFIQSLSIFLLGPSSTHYCNNG